MRSANLLARRILAELGTMIVPGATTATLDARARELTHAAGAKPAFYQYRAGGHSPFPGHICASVNATVVHGIPNDRPLVEGDVVSIDYGCFLDGWCGDTAYTWCVGEPSATARHLMTVTKEALAVGIAAAQSGRRVFDIARAVQQHCESNGCGVVRSLVGHGCGSAMHEPPQVPNFADPASRHDRLRPGMTICIEPMVTAGGWQTKELPGGWEIVSADGSLAAHYEHCIAITDDGPDILSLPDDL
jgi:methionyl aminopeptidase